MRLLLNNPTWTYCCLFPTNEVATLVKALIYAVVASHMIHTWTFSSSALSIMNISFALTGKGYVLVAADTTAARSIVKMKVDEDKIKVLSPHLLMAYSGEPGESLLLSIY